MATAEILMNGVSTPNESLKIGDLVTFTNSDNTGVSAWAWTLVSKPSGSAATLSSATDSTTSLTVDVEGAYLVRLVVNAGLVGAAAAQAVCRVLTANIGLKPFAKGETREGDAVEGWAKGWRESYLLIDKAVGLPTDRRTVFYTGSTTSLPLVLEATGETHALPNGDVVPVVAPADSANPGKLLFVSDGADLTNNTAVRAVTHGLTGLVAVAGSPTLGALVYTDSSGNLTTVKPSESAVQPVGVCLSVAGSNARIWVDASLTYGTPVGLGAAADAGSSAAVARADHVHGHGDLGGGTLHAVATPLVAGFMSATDKGVVSAISSLPSSSVVVTTAPGSPPSGVSGGSSGDVLTWNGAAWISAAPTGGGGGIILPDPALPAGSVLAISDAGDALVGKRGTAVGDLLIWDGTRWIDNRIVDVAHGGTNADALHPGGVLVTNLTGDEVTSVAAAGDKDVLTWNGTTWVTNQLIDIAHGGTNSDNLAANGILVVNAAGDEVISTVASSVGDLLIWSGTNWVPNRKVDLAHGGTNNDGFPAYSLPLVNDTADTIEGFVGSLDGQYLKWNGTRWIAEALPETGVTPGEYGSASAVPVITVDAQGRITLAANTTIAIAQDQVTGLDTALGDKVPSSRTISAGVGLSGGGDLTADRTIEMPDVGTAGVYGTADSVAVITTDDQGRVSNAVTTSIAITESQVANLTSDLSTINNAIEMLVTDVGNLQSGGVPSTRTITTTNGLQGGGDLSADRTLSPVYGSSANTVTEGNDPRLSDARTPTGAASGDLTGTYPAPTVTAIQGRNIPDVAPVSGQVLTWNGSDWVPASAPLGGSGGGGRRLYLNEATSPQAPTTNIPLSTDGLVSVKQLGTAAVAGLTTITSSALSQVSYDIVAGFVTDLNVPDATSIPAGVWDFNVWASASGNTTNQTIFRIGVYKYDGVNAPVLIANSDDVYIYDPTVTAQYSVGVIIPAGTTLLGTDRIYVQLDGKGTATNRTVTFSFGDAKPTHVHTTLPSVTGTGIVHVIDGVMQSPASPVALDSSDVSGILPIANGGTHTNAVPTNGQLLIGNGTGYTVSALTAGTAIGITNGAGSVTVDNNGVTSLVAGTGISLSGATGSVTVTNTLDGLDFWTDSESGAGVNATVPVDCFTVKNAATDVDAAIRAKGAGATLAQIPDGLTVGGDKRGQYATDWQKSRSNSNQVASGDYSTVSGGRDNKATGVGATIVGGYNNTASGEYVVAGGVSMTVSGARAVGIGAQSTVSGNYASSIGFGNTVSGTSASAIGYNATSSGLASFAAGNGTASADYAVGINATASADVATAVGGAGNSATAIRATVVGGQNNVVAGQFAGVFGGYGNVAPSAYEVGLGYQSYNFGGTSNSYVNTDVAVGYGNGGSGNAFTFLKNGALALGRGTAKPKDQLDVNGNARVTGAIVQDGFTSGAAISAGQVCYLAADGFVYPAQANSSTTSTVVGVAVETVGSSGATIALAISLKTGGFSSLTVGTEYFLASTSAGAVVTYATLSAVSGVEIVSLGYARSATEIQLSIQRRGTTP